MTGCSSSSSLAPAAALTWKVVPQAESGNWYTTKALFFRTGTQPALCPLANCTESRATGGRVTSRETAMENWPSGVQWAVTGGKDIISLELRGKRDGKEALTSQPRQGQQVLQAVLPLAHKTSAKHGKTSATSSNNTTNSGHKTRSVAIQWKMLDTPLGHYILGRQKHSPEPPVGVVHSKLALPAKWGIWFCSSSGGREHSCSGLPVLPK